MPNFYVDLIFSIDSNVDPEKVGDVADHRHGVFSSMTRGEWASCVEAVKVGGA